MHNDKNINKFGLLNSLISLINESDDSASDVTVAKYLLQNYNRLHDLNIYDIAEECCVSRATIRRLAIKIGFENFRDLKDQNLNSSEYPFYHSGIENDESGNTVVQQIANMASECEQFFNEERKDTIVQELHQATQIVFLTNDVYSRQSSEFQKALILSGKMVRVVSSKFMDNEVLSNLKQNDILIVISVSGFFASQVVPFVQGNMAKKVLLTTVNDDLYKTVFDEIWYLSSEPKIGKRNVYTLYATQYCLERIFAAYVKKYKI